MQIKVVGYTLLPLTTSDNVSGLETTISRLVPDVFASGLRVDDASCAISGDATVARRNFVNDEIKSEVLRQEKRRSLWQARLPSGLPEAMRRSHGSVHFVSNDESENLHVHFDDWTLSPSQLGKRIGNSVSIEKEFDQSHSQISEVVCQLCLGFFDGSFFDYGFVCSTEEFLEKNVDQSNGGQRAVGLDASKYLPGLYWGNYFSDRLRERMPRVGDKLRGYDSIQLSNGLLLIGTDEPCNWNKPENLADTSTAIKHIGEQFFFNTNANEREELFTVTD